MNKKVISILSVSFIIIALIILCVVFNVVNKNKESNLLFKRVYTDSSSFVHSEKGINIYDDGTIESIELYPVDKVLYVGKISKNELKDLKKLANGIAEESTSVIDLSMPNGGTAKAEIYNLKLGKWILLYEYKDISIKNNSNETDLIINYVQKLIEKYINGIG